MEFPTHIRRSRAVHGLLGVVLLAAAGLKLSGLNVSPLAQYGWFSTPGVQVPAIAWEAALGIWLLSGSSRAGSWLAAVATFALFAEISLSLGLVGQASCGCFVAIRASPWHALAVDAAALGLLVAAWPGRASLHQQSAILLPSLRSGTIGVVAGVVASLGVLALVGSMVYGSPTAALARLRGESLGVSPPHLDFGSGAVGQDLDGAVRVDNWTDQTVRLVGGTSDCSCTTLADLPLTIEPGGSVAVRVQLRVPAGGAGQMTRTVFLQTDSPDQPVVRFRVGCLVE